MESAFNDEVALDRARLAWDSKVMRRRHGRIEGLAGFGSAAPGSAGRQLRWLLAALVVCLSAGLACRGPDERAGAGGQSGDEGRRPSAPWLGTGGVTSEPLGR
jgi:hypothetical protein